MLGKIMAASVIVFLSTCADGVDGTPGSLPTDETPDDPTSGGDLPAGEQRLAKEVDICTLLPTEGACAHACDPDALADFVPPGTCASFMCPLTDGTTYHTGACNPE